MDNYMWSVCISIESKYITDVFISFFLCFSSFCLHCPFLSPKTRNRQPSLASLPLPVFACQPFAEPAELAKPAELGELAEPAQLAETAEAAEPAELAA